MIHILHKRIFGVLALILLLSSCSKSKGEDTNSSYNVISDGTSSGINFEIEKNESDAAFYVPSGMVTRYQSKNLTDYEYGIYQSLLKSIGQFDKKIMMSDDANIYGKCLDIIRTEQLAYSQIANRYVGDFVLEDQEFELLFEYRYTDPKQLSDMNREAEKVADKILNGITDSMSDYEMLKYFHDYLINNCESDVNAQYADTIYGALVNHKALCEGYAKAYSYLCNRVGIENIIVTGMTTVPHMWNMVRVNGEWYHVDVTWDKPDTSINGNYPDVILYQYFMITDSVINNTHKTDDAYKAHTKAESMAENYFVKENKYVTSEEECIKVIESALINAVKNKENSVMIKFSSSDYYIAAQNKFNKGDYESLQSIINNISKDFDIELNIKWTPFYSTYRIMLFVIEYK